MQTARAALGVALRVCPRTAVSTYTRPAAGMVLVHTSPPRPSGSQQNCLRPDMPYKTGHADWSGLDLGLFIGAGVLVTAGLYEHKRSLATHTPSEVPPFEGAGVQYVPSVNSQYTGLNLVSLAPQTPAGVLCRSAAFPLGKNDRKVAGSEASGGDKKDQQVFAQFGRPAETNEETTSTEEANKCPRDVSDETPTAVGPVKMRDKALSAVEDVRTASTESKTSGDEADGRDIKEVFNDAVNKRGTPQCLPDTKTRADHNEADVSSENDVTASDDDQGPTIELMTSNSDISDQKSPSACPLGGGQVSEGNVGKDHDFCGDDVTSDISTDVMNTCSLPNPADGENAGNDVISSSGETSPRRADFTEAEVITVTACPVRHELSAATREVIGSTPHVTDKTDTEISSEQFLSEGHFDSESGHLSQHVPVSPRLQRKLRCAVFYADWREDSQFCHRDDVTTDQKVRFSWFGQEHDDDLDDVTEVKVYCAVLEGVWREECGLVENHVTNTTGGDDDMESYYPGHGRRNGIQSGNENWV
ncbi:uncharacterized protein LOC118428198 [Branchiostoma floridae]|uniref:Uncharacterized protein LOC118428198 n=1 Tax=Branchiostoma floridae TaxID=7739 RepID=A0A9J7N979_BRAFL|nr:uncharacterized protein LOC118428198 [Branchiostoma floridae]